MSSSVNIFEYSDFRAFVKAKLKAMPKQGYGQFRKIANFLSMSSVMISQIFNGVREIGPEQGHKLSHFFNLSKLEREYFFTLVQISRAGSVELKEYYQEKLDELKEKSKKLVNIVDHDKKMSDKEKAKFYSNWYYSGIRLYSSLNTEKDISSLASRFKIPPETAAEVVEFLLSHGLCIKENDELKMGPARIHLESSSPYVRSRQMDWRLKGFEKMPNQRKKDLFYTAPLSVSHQGEKEIRQKLNEFIRNLTDIVISEEPQILKCLNIDFFDF